MARSIKTLESIVRDVRYETGRNPDRNFGIDEYDAIKYLVQRTQKFLWWEYDWRHLRVRVDLTLNAGQRYYDVPTGISFERIVEAQVQFGSTWLDLSSGIDMNDYSLYDSDADARSDPALKWDIININGTAQIEIFPIPVATQTARFTGTGELADFTADDDNCTLDATLITVVAAAKLEPEQKELQAAASRLMVKMRAYDATVTPGNRISMAGGDSPLSRGLRSGRKEIVVISG